MLLILFLCHLERLASGRNEAKHYISGGSDDFTFGPSMDTQDPPVVPRVTLKQLSLPGGAELMRGGRPFVITHATKHWNFSKLHPSYLKRRFPKSVVDYYPNNLMFTSNKPMLIPMVRALAGLGRAQ